MRTISVVVLTAVIITMAVSVAPAQVAATESIALSAIGSRGDVYTKQGGLMGVVEVVHPGNPKANVFAVVTPEQAPMIRVYPDPDLLLGLSITASTINWKMIVIKNSALGNDWEIRWDRRELDKIMARDAGDWITIELGVEHIVPGRPNVFSVRLDDDGSHKQGPLGIGKWGIRNTSLLTFTVEVVHPEDYPFDVAQDFSANPVLGVSNHEAGLIKTEEGGWESNLPGWYRKAIQDTTKVRVEVPPGVASSRRPTPAASQTSSSHRPATRPTPRLTVLRDRDDKGNARFDYVVNGLVIEVKAKFLKRAVFAIENADGSDTISDRTDNGDYLKGMDFSSWSPGTSTRVKIRAWDQSGLALGEITLRITKEG